MKLFDYFAADGFHTSIVSTFCVDFDAYEAIALPRLRGSRCNNNVLIVDARMLAQVLSDDARRPKFAGRHYSVVGAQCAGVFHPKLTLQLGNASGRLLVSSANMTAAGLAGNLEIVGELIVRKDDAVAAPLLRAAVDYLLKFLAPESVARRQVEWALRRTPWLPATTSADVLFELGKRMGLAFIAREDAKGIGQRFIEFIGDRTVKRLVVVSPYWDRDLRTLSRLRRRFVGADIAVLIQPATRLYPTHAHPGAGDIALYDVSKTRASAKRFPHAKILIAEAAEDDCVLFGSANCTEAALGNADQTGINEEACLARELPAGAATRMLGLDEVLALGAELDVEEIDDVLSADDIPMSDLDARLAGRFELSGDILRWWPPTSLVTEQAIEGVDIQLLDHRAAPVAGALTRLGDQHNPSTYRFDGTVTPHFAKVIANAFESLLAVVVIEQAIHQTQLRAASKGAESALELLDDDEAFEGLWLLEVIQRLTEAEFEMRGPRETVEQAPHQRVADKPTQDSRVLSYDEFVAGRRTQGDFAGSSGSHLAATHHESVRTFLNALIGKRVTLDSIDIPDDTEPTLNFSLGDEARGGEIATESESLSPSAVDLTDAGRLAETKPQVERRGRYVQDTQRSIVDGVEVFLKGLREQARARPLCVVDLLRLRALLMVVLGAGSKKVDLQFEDLSAPGRRRQVLPFVGEASWRRLVGRLLYEFFRDTGGVRSPLINSLRLEIDERQGLPEDVLECWATCFWAICAMRVAVNDDRDWFPVSKPEADLATDLYRFTRLLPQEAIGTVVEDVFSRMSHRYAERLGASAKCTEQEHLALVEAARARAATVHS